MLTPGRKKHAFQLHDMMIAFGGRESEAGRAVIKKNPIGKNALC